MVPEGFRAAQSAWSACGHGRCLLTQQGRGSVQPGFAAPPVPACSGVHQHKGSYSFYPDSPCQSVKVMFLLCHGKAVTSAKQNQKNNLSPFLSHNCFSLEESCIWSRWRKMFHSLEHHIPLLVWLFLVVTGTLYWTQAIQSVFNPRGCNRGCLLLLIHTASLFCPLTIKLIKSISTFLFKEKNRTLIFLWNVCLILINYQSLY